MDWMTYIGSIKTNETIMEKFKFLRRGEEITRYNRAKKLLGETTFASIRQKLEKEIHDYELKSKIIEFFANHPKLETRKNNSGNMEYVLPMRFVRLKSNKYEVYDGEITCPAKPYKENYADSWRNIGADYHSLYINDGSGENGFWLCNDSTWEQIQNQDNIEKYCNEKNLLLKNYF